MAKFSRRMVARIIAEKLTAKGADMPGIMRTLAAFLAENNMLHDADLVMNDIAEELFRLNGQLAVAVTSARNLSDEARANLTDYLRQQTGATSVDIAESVDPSLIGGLIAQTPSSELDISVRNKLRQLTALA